MIKEDDYYKALDLRAVSAQLPVDRAARMRSDELGDLIYGILFQCSAAPIRGDDLRSLLGEPDLIRSSPHGQVWEYQWIGTFGPNEYTSATPFVLRDDRVVGIEGDDDVVASD